MPPSSGTSNGCCPRSCRCCRRSCRCCRRRSNWAGRSRSRTCTRPRGEWAHRTAACRTCHRPGTRLRSGRAVPSHAFPGTGRSRSRRCTPPRGEWARRMAARRTCLQSCTGLRYGRAVPSPAFPGLRWRRGCGGGRSGGRGRRARGRGLVRPGGLCGTRRPRTAAGDNQGRGRGRRGELDEVPPRHADPAIVDVNREYLRLLRHVLFVRHE